MNDRGGLLTLAAYLTTAMVIVIVVCWGIFRYGAMGRVSSLGPIPNEPSPELAVTGLKLPPDSPTPSASGSLDQQRIKLLESMLAERAELVRQQAEQIDQQAADLGDLQQRYEDAMLVLDTLQPAPVEVTDPPEGKSSPEDDPDLDPERLEAELMLAREIHDALVSDLDARQGELDKAYQEIEELRQAVNDVSTRHLQDALAMETATAGVVLRVGQEAVPALTDALGHVNPAVRRWAATVLGGLGQDAGEATGALIEALSDSDPSVRRAAKAALDAIER